MQVTYYVIYPTLSNLFSTAHFYADTGDLVFKLSGGNWNYHLPSWNKKTWKQCRDEYGDLVTSVDRLTWMMAGLPLFDEKKVKTNAD